MGNTKVRKAAWLSAAGVMAATAVVGTTQTAADASVTTSCGPGLNANSTTDRTVVEKLGPKVEPGWGTYPAISLRNGLLNGNTVFWARASTPESGVVVMDWYKSGNSGTHYKCSQEMWIGGGNYTKAINWGWHSLAWVFRPCVARSQSGLGGTGVLGPWECDAWWG